MKSSPTCPRLLLLSLSSSRNRGCRGGVSNSNFGFTYCSRKRLSSNTNTNKTTNPTDDTSNTSTSTTARSVYVARLRRAFLLRVHPDRFRYHKNYHNIIQQKQSTLVKALVQRLNQPDFIQWQTSTIASTNTTTTGSLRTSRNNNDSSKTQNENENKEEDGIYSYVVEKRDGTLFPTTIQLHHQNTTVEDILKMMSYAVQVTGAVVVDPPPPPLPTSPPSSSQSQSQQQKQYYDDPIFYSNPNPHIHKKQSTINHQYDIMSNKGRNIRTFLLYFHEKNEQNYHSNSTSTSNHHHHHYYNTSTNENNKSNRNTNTNHIHHDTNTWENIIQRRKAYRVDVQTLALLVRQLYRFQSVDAIQTGWSSESVANLLRRFIQLHIEHASASSSSSKTSAAFKVQSFYPLRLVFTPTTTTTTITTTNNNNITTNTTTHPEEENTFSSSTSQDKQQEQQQNHHYHHAIDMYEGIVQLTPDGTTLQWLQILQCITLKMIQTIQDNRSKIQQRHVQYIQYLGCHIKKGKSCTSNEYYTFLQTINIPTTTIISANQHHHHQKTNTSNTTNSHNDTHNNTHTNSTTTAIDSQNRASSTSNSGLSTSSQSQPPLVASQQQQHNEGEETSENRTTTTATIVEKTASTARSSSSSSVSLVPDSNVVVTIESARAIRKVRISPSKDGTIQVPHTFFHMSPSTTTSTNDDDDDSTNKNENINSLGHSYYQFVKGVLDPYYKIAYEQSIQYQQQRKVNQQCIHQIQVTYGVTKVYRATPLLTEEQFYHALQQLLSFQPTTTTATGVADGSAIERKQSQSDDDVMTIMYQLLKLKLAGNSLGIAGEGQFCRLADDGSIVIPYNFTY